MTESLARTEKELHTLNLSVERKDGEIVRLGNCVKQEENRTSLLQQKLDEAVQTISKHEENIMNIQLREEDSKVRNYRDINWYKYRHILNKYLKLWIKNISST